MVTLIERAHGATVYTAPRQDKPWGHEVIFAAGEAGYVGKVISVSAGHSLSLQLHERKVETISILQGEGVVEFGAHADALSRRALVPGDTIHLPAFTVHRMTATTDLVFVEASTADEGWREDVVRLEDKYGRAGTSTP
jgi:mannose-6-phosphate isomerase-like protein (cupin superfamily)